MVERILNYVNICVKKGHRVLLLNRQHDEFKGWIQPGGKVEFPESFFEAAKRELKEKTGLTALNLQLKGISGFTNPKKAERYVYYDFLCEGFEGEILTESREGVPKWWAIEELPSLEMQDDIRERLPLYWRAGSFERIHYWDEERGCIAETKTILYD
ncbi:8-oxo-dGTP diphosphatase [Streptococcus himalayensis]|uniref:7,8-dihydro-8-oxoguanine triphosphatase n=1 Tax=Streptococcus himalayensis TaxID=1888195 RepID=A0A917A6T6_9STRE|nr:8-oxo-dGTP diphosphatase [Streptococcus himalayensis]GGE31466.1 7,8-dihydro-8-oxoguanine triphosphatase [Streptococcus himalayensis]